MACLLLGSALCAPFHGCALFADPWPALLARPGPASLMGLLGLVLLAGACSGATGDPLTLPASPSGTPECVASTAEPLVECPTERVEGVDVFDGQGDIDWAAVADAGIAFAMIKATQGTYDTQATFAANWAGAARAGIRRGAYHFFDPNDDGAAQAARFLAVVGPLGPSDLPPMLDVECPDGDSDCLGTGNVNDGAASGRADPGLIAARVWAWLGAVEGATGRAPMLYTFSRYFVSSAVDAGGLEAFPLFLADPTSDTCFGVPAPWSVAAFWQWSWSGVVPGIAGAVDRDRFIGSPADFASFGGVPGGGADASVGIAPAGSGAGVGSSGVVGVVSSGAGGSGASGGTGASADGGPFPDCP